MSFTVRLESFQRGVLSSFERSLAYNIFCDHIYNRTEGLELWYENNYNGTLSLDDEFDITGISINRPGDAALRGLYALATLTPSLIYWNTACAVAKEAYIPGIPDWMIKAFGHPPIIAHSADELIQAIANS